MAFCGQCGSAVTEGHLFCGSCGARVGTAQISAAPRAAAAAAAAPAQEKTFYQDTTVVVTNSRCIVAGQTYAMSGITSVRPFTEVPSKGGPILLIIVGALLVMGGFGQSSVFGVVLGIITVAVGIAWYKSKKDIYHVVVHSASGESRLIHSIDRSYITSIIAALNEAIVYRS